jgi:hypothetical protein
VLFRSVAEAVPPGWPAGHRRLGPALFVVAIIVIVGFAAPIVTAIPGLAGLFRADEIAFAGVKSAFLRQRGEDTIVVEGDLVNTTGHAVTVPAIRISLRDGAAGEIYAWLVEPTASELAAGASLGFRSAMAPPVAGGEHVALSLAERAGPAVGMR